MKKFPCLDFLMKSNLMVIYFHLTVFLNLILFTSSVFCSFSESYKRWPQLTNCSREPSQGSSSEGLWLSACSPRLFGPSLSLMVWRFFPANQPSNNFPKFQLWIWRTTTLQGLHWLRSPNTNSQKTEGRVPPQNKINWHTLLFHQGFLYTNIYIHVSTERA